MFRKTVMRYAQRGCESMIARKEGTAALLLDEIKVIDTPAKGQVVAEAAAVVFKDLKQLYQEEGEGFKKKERAAIKDHVGTINLLRATEEEFASYRKASEGKIAELEMQHEGVLTELADERKNIGTHVEAINQLRGNEEKFASYKKASQDKIAELEAQLAQLHDTTLRAARQIEKLTDEVMLAVNEEPR